MMQNAPVGTGTRKAFRWWRSGLIAAGMALAILSAMFLTGGAATEVSGQTQQQMNKEACDDYKKADLAMNQAYQTILRDYKTDRVFIASLRKAQLAWIQYRDAHVESIYPGAPSQYGSVNDMCRCSQLAAITRERTKNLNVWVAGIEEGDVCAGSVKIKG